jgi:hypothetical protein
MKDKRFVIQEHETADGVHWDLMLEQDDALTTFRLEEPPEQVLVHPVRAEKIFDHPLRFLSYEGPVQKGTGRVHIVERGSWQPVECDRHAVGANNHSPLLPTPSCRFILEGTILSGTFTLVRTSETEWRFAFEGVGSDPDHLPR